MSKEWKRLGKNLEKAGGLDAAIKKTSKLQDGTKNSAQQLKEFQDVAGDTDSILMALAGGLGEINPELGAMVGLGAEVSSVLEAVAKSGAGLAKFLGPLVVVVATGAAAFNLYKKRAEEATQAIEEQKQATQRLEQGFEDWNDVQQDVMKDHLVAAGLLDEMDRKQEKLEESILAGAEAYKKEQQARVDAANAAIQAEKERAKTEATGTESINEHNAILLELNKTRDQEVAKLEEIQAQVFGTIDLSRQTLALEKEKIQKTQESTEAKDQEAEAIKREMAALMAEEAAMESMIGTREEEAEAIKRQNQQLQDQEKLRRETLETIQGLAEGLDDIVGDQFEKPGTEMERFKKQTQGLKDALTDQTNQAIADLNALTEEEALMLSKRDGTRQEFMHKANEEAIEIYRQEMAARREIWEAEIAMEQKMRTSAIRESSTMAIQLVDMLATAELERRQTNLQKLEKQLEDSSENMTAAEKKRHKERIEIEKQAITRAFRAQQAAAVAKIGMDTASAIMATFAQFGFPMGLGPAILMAGIGAVNAGLVLSEKPPTYHAGGMIVPGSAPDEVQITAARGEAILNTQGVANAGGPNGINALNNGRSGAQPQVVIMQYKNRVLDVVMEDVNRRPGPIRRAIRSRAGRVGHRR